MNDDSGTVWIAIKFFYEKDVLEHIGGQWVVGDGYWRPVAMTGQFESKLDAEKRYGLESDVLRFVQVKAPTVMESSDD